MKNLVPAGIQDTLNRSWHTLGTVVAVLSPLQDFVLIIISLAAETSETPGEANGWCKGMLCRSVHLSLILLWAGRQQGSKIICHRAIKRQRPRSDEQFAHNCCQTGGLMHDVIYFVRMCKT